MQDVRQEGDDNEIITNIQTQICGYNTIITANQDTCRMTMDAAPKVTNITNNKNNVITCT